MPVNLARSAASRRLRAFLELIPLQNLIRKTRIEKGWSQGQVAQKTGVARQTINAIENNRSIPTLKLALKLAQAFGKPVDELFQLEKARRESPF